MRVISAIGVFVTMAGLAQASTPAPDGGVSAKPQRDPTARIERVVSKVKEKISEVKMRILAKIEERQGQRPGAGKSHAGGSKRGKRAENVAGQGPGARQGRFQQKMEKMQERFRGRLAQIRERIAQSDLDEAGKTRALEALERGQAEIRAALESAISEIRSKRPSQPIPSTPDSSGDSRAPGPLPPATGGVI